MPNSQRVLLLVHLDKTLQPMKLTVFLLFAAAMLFYVATGSLSLQAAYIAIFVVGALLSQPAGAYCNSAVSGMLTRSQATTNDDVGEWQSEILVRQGKSANMNATLFGLMSRLPKEETDSVTYNHWERDPVRRNIYTNGGNLLSNSTTLTFDDGATNSVYPILAANTLLYNERTSEVIRVSGDPAADAFTVVRAQGGTSGAAILDNDLWTIIGAAKDEGADPIRNSYEQPSNLYNYIQTFNATVFLANAYKAGVLRTDIEGPMQQNRLQALEKIANDIELTLFLGHRGTASGSNGTIYMTGGLKNMMDIAITADSNLSANKLNGNGTSGVLLTSLLDWFQAILSNGSDTKLMFCGPQSFGALSKFANQAAGGFRIMNNEGDVFGMNLTNIQTPFGEVSLCMHPLFKNVKMLNDWAFVVDLQLLAQKEMEPLFYEDNIQTPGQDSYKGQFRAKLGLKQKFAGAFGYVYDFSQINA